VHCYLDECHPFIATLAVFQTIPLMGRRSPKKEKPDRLKSCKNTARFCFGHLFGQIVGAECETLAVGAGRVTRSPRLGGPALQKNEKSKTKAGSVLYCVSLAKHDRPGLHGDLVPFFGLVSCGHRQPRRQ
jgi:hypothetical protein